jgi:hypothetical protein
MRGFAMHDGGDDFAILAAADGTVWIARRQADGTLIVSDAAARQEPLRLSGVEGWWGAVVDHAGIPWVVTAEDGVVQARRYRDGAWGPRLQVSTRPERAVTPMVVADEYANAWIFWRYVESGELWMCRMGPRSGQETLVARGQSPRLLTVATREGRFFVLYEDGSSRLMLAVGTEHGGFAAAVEVDQGGR